MLAKLKSMKNSAGAKLEELKINQFMRSVYSFCKKSYEYSRKKIDEAGKKISKTGVSANLITITGFVIGIFAINFLSLRMFGYALACIILNRIFDALDGAIARNSKVTDFGVFLDAALDYIFYAGVIFGFALANPMQNAVPAAFLLFAFTAAACSMLAYAIIAYKNNTSKKLELNQSPFYLGGIAQGSETLVALVVMCLVPVWFLQIAIILGILCFVKAVSVMITAYYNFVIAARPVNPDSVIRNSKK